MNLRHDDWKLPPQSGCNGVKPSPVHQAKGITRMSQARWSTSLRTNCDNISSLALQDCHQDTMRVDASCVSKSYTPYRASCPPIMGELLPSDVKRANLPYDSASKASKPQLHLTENPKSITTPRIHVCKVSSPVKILQSTRRNAVSLPAQQLASPSHVSLSVDISPQISSVPPTASQNANSAPSSLSTPPCPQSPKPRYGDERFQTLPEEAYSWIDTPAHRQNRVEISSLNELPGIYQARTASAVSEHDHSFWRAAIEPVVDPRSGMNYYEQHKTRPVDQARRYATP